MLSLKLSLTSHVLVRLFSHTKRGVTPLKNYTI
nr:MAG TPA: hypothetical protein [Caudoviricetes sp.]